MVLIILTFSETARKEKEIFRLNSKCDVYESKGNLRTLHNIFGDLFENITQ